MANPLSWFRKYQKIMLVFFGVILMAVFGLGSVISMIPAGAGRNDRDAELKQVIAEWSGGKVRRGEIEQFWRYNLVAAQLVGGVEALKLQEVRDNMRTATPSNRLDLIDPLVTGAESQRDRDRKVMYRMMQAERARELGMAVTDQMVQEYLDQIYGKEISDFQLREVHKNVNGNTFPTDIRFVLEHLKIELMAKYYQDLASLKFLDVPNASQSFADFRKMNQRIQCQLAAFPVSDYLESVGDVPADSELKKIYEEGKYEFPDDENSKPGFKTLPMVKLAYFSGNEETFIQNAMQKLLPEDVQKEYQRLVDAEDDLVIENLVTPDDLEVPDIDAPGPGENSEEGSTGSDDNQPPVLPGTTESNENTNDSKSGDDGSDGDNSDADASADGDKEESGDEKSGDGQGDSGSGDNPSPADAGTIPTSLSGVRQDENQQEQEGKSDDSTQQAGDVSAENESQTDDDQDEANTADENQQDVGNETATDQLNPPADEKRVKEFSEVEEAIKRSMVEADARQRLQDAYDEVMEEMEGYRAGYEYYLSTEKEEDRPEPVDYQALADRLKLSFVETEFMDETNYMENPVGKIQEISIQGQQDFRFVPVGLKLLASFEQLNLYQPFRASELGGSGPIVYWVIEKADVSVPSFADAKDAVVDYWKMQQAQQLAEKAASEFMAKVQSAQQPMLSVDPDSVQQTGSFSWFQFPQNQFGGNRGVTYSAVAGTDGIGEKFMTDVFALQPMDVTVTRNETRDVFYAVQLIEQDDEPLNDQYFTLVETTQSMPVDAQMVAGFYDNRYRFEAVEGLFESMQVKWLTD